MARATLRTPDMRPHGSTFCPLPLPVCRLPLLMHPHLAQKVGALIFAIDTHGCLGRRPKTIKHFFFFAFESKKLQHIFGYCCCCCWCVAGVAGAGVCSV